MYFCLFAIWAAKSGDLEKIGSSFRDWNLGDGVAFAVGIMEFDFFGGNFLLDSGFSSLKKDYFDISLPI